MLKAIENADDDGSWQKLLKETEAVSDNEDQRLDKLTQIVLEVFLNRFEKESTEKKKKKKKIVETNVFNHGPGIGTGSQCYPKKEDKEEHLIKKQEKNISPKKGFKRRPRTISQTPDEGEKEEYLISKQNKQKTSGNIKKQNQNKRLDPMAELAASGLEPPPDIPEAFKDHIEKKLNGTDIKLVIQKIIHKTDLKRSQNRLSMPKKQVRNKFMSEAEEEEKLKNNAGMDVKLIQPSLKECTVRLSKWVIGGSSAYIFKTQWNDVVKNNRESLKPKAVVQIWSFREGPESQLGFAMVKVKDGEDGHQID